MSGVDLTSIRLALAGRIDSGVSEDINVYEYEPPRVAFPCIIIRPASEYVTYHDTLDQYGPVCEIRFAVRLYWPQGSIEGQRHLDGFCSSGTGQPNSIRDAISADRQLAQTVSAAIVESILAVERELIAPPDGQTPCDAIEATVLCVLQSR